MAYTKKRSPAVSQASPAHSLFLRRIGAEGRNFTSSTPAAVPRPLPEFVEENNRLFHIKNNLPFRSSHLLPKSPAKSAPPKSRVFPHRQWAHYKAHAVSFRDENNAADSAIQSKFYDSDRSELYFEQCFTIEKKVGEGSFGEVMKVKSLDSGKQYAIKRSREKFRNETDRKRKLDEVKKHEQIPKHPNCVEFVKAWEENQRLYIQTELCKMSVQEYWETKGSVPEVRVWQMLIDLLNGLEHIHSHGFIHLDIKPANIFLSDSGVCKIGDFGLVVEHTDIADAREGDNKYMAPELLNSVFSAKADVFSLGITILELASNMELPKQGNAWRLLRVGYIPPECVEGISQELHSIIQWMLAPECDERPTISDVLNHPAVKNHKRKMMPSKVYAVFERVLCACIFYLLALVKFFLCPFKILLRALPKPKIESVSNMDKCQWETTDPHLHRTSSNESICAPELSQHHTVTFFTPKVKSRNHSHFTPTPRNSSPMASRSMHRYPGDISPDLSPLSHNKSHGNRLDSIGTHQSNLNFFLSDLSDTEDSMYKSDSLLATKPRNLLDELNNLSDSDA